MTSLYTSFTDPRRVSVLTAIVGLHAGLYLALVSGLDLRWHPVPEGEPPPVTIIPREAEPPKVVMPGPFEPIDGVVAKVAFPEPLIPDIGDPLEGPSQATGAVAGETGGAGVQPASVDFLPAALRMRNDRLAALVDACYPAASRRLAEEGRAIAQVTVGASGEVVAWSVHATSGYPRLDAAMDCVIRRLVIEPARRDGRAVQSVVRLPIAFRLN